uniref:Uncharacterized protein n=3 Tax=Cacopsylla melanoneura TaxID=428564 RepID=A0A8D9A8F3_9HEMI
MCWKVIPPLLYCFSCPLCTTMLSSRRLLSTLTPLLNMLTTTLTCCVTFASSLSSHHLTSSSLCCSHDVSCYRSVIMMVLSCLTSTVTFSPVSVSSSPLFKFCSSLTCSLSRLSLMWISNVISSKATTSTCSGITSSCCYY